MGLIMSALGGMADAGQNMVTESMRNDAVEARDKRQAELQESLVAKRQESIEAARAKREADAATRYADQADKVDRAAEETRTGREINSMKSASSTPEKWNEADTETVKNLPPAARKAYEDAGMIPKRTGSGLIRDKMDAAGKIGADPTLRGDLRKDYGTALDKEKADAIAETQRRRQESTDAANDRKGDQRDRQLDILAGKASGSSDKANLKAETLAVTKAREKRLDIQKQIDTTINMVKEGLVKRAEAQAEIAELKKQQIRYDKIIDGQPDSPDNNTGKPAKLKPALSSLPAGAKQIGTSKGKPVYETPDGKRFIGD